MGLRRVLLLRHAKSSWDNPRLNDFERPLAPRGRKAAPRMGVYMRETGLVPDRVLVSPAQRALETWELVEEAMGTGSEVEFERALYHAAPDTMLRLLQSQPINDETVMIVAHNPGMEALATGLVSRGDEQAYESLRIKYPTGALAEITFEVDRWGEIDWGEGTLVRFVVPRELT